MLNEVYIRFILSMSFVIINYFIDILVSGHHNVIINNFILFLIFAITFDLQAVGIYIFITNNILICTIDLVFRRQKYYITIFNVHSIITRVLLNMGPLTAQPQVECGLSAL